MGNELVPNITVDVKVRFVGPNEFYFEQRLLPIDSKEEPVVSGQENSEPDLHFVVPSRSNGPHPHGSRFYKSA